MDETDILFTQLKYRIQCHAQTKYLDILFTEHFLEAKQIDLRLCDQLCSHILRPN